MNTTTKKTETQHFFGSIFTVLSSDSASPPSGRPMFLNSLITWTPSFDHTFISPKTIISLSKLVLSVMDQSSVPTSATKGKVPQTASVLIDVLPHRLLNKRSRTEHTWPTSLGHFWIFGRRGSLGAKLQKCCNSLQLLVVNYLNKITPTRLPFSRAVGWNSPMIARCVDGQCEAARLHDSN